MGRRRAASQYIRDEEGSILRNIEAYTRARWARLFHTPPCWTTKSPNLDPAVVDHLIKQRYGLHDARRRELYVPSVVETTDAVPSKADRKERLVRTNLRPKR